MASVGSAALTDLLHPSSLPGNLPGYHFFPDFPARYKATRLRCSGPGFSVVHSELREQSTAQTGQHLKAQLRLHELTSEELH